MTFAGEKLDRCSLERVLKGVAEAIQWDKVAPHGNRGKGLACGQWNTMGIGCGIEVMITRDSDVEIITGSVDLTGSSTVLAQVAAEELSVPLEKVRIRTESTSRAIEAPASGGSWLAYNMSNATRIACQQAKDKLLEIAAQELDLRPEDLGIDNGHIFNRQNTDRPGDWHLRRPNDIEKT